LIYYEDHQKSSEIEVAKLVAEVKLPPSSRLEINCPLARLLPRVLLSLSPSAALKQQRTQKDLSSNAFYIRGSGRTGIALDNGGIRATKAAKGR